MPAKDRVLPRTLTLSGTLFIAPRTPRVALGALARSVRMHAMNYRRDFDHVMAL